MNKKSLLRRFLTGVFIGTLTIGMGSCISNGQRMTNSPTSTSFFSKTPSGSRTSTATVAPRPAWTKIQLVVPTATLRPFATIDPEDRDAFIESMNDKCKLPCWGDITPGITTESDAKHFFSSFGIIVESTSIYFDYHEKPAVIDLTFKDELVSSINLPPELTKAYKISSLLSRYGVPGDVKIEVIPETAEGTPWFFLALFYPQEGLVAIFVGEGEIVDSKVNACLEDKFPDLYLVEAGKYSLDQIGGFLDPNLRNILQPLQSLTELDKDHFYDAFVQQQGQCLVTTVHAP